MSTQLLTNAVRGRRIGNERGIALPLALFGLILVSVLVTGVLLSASTEVAVSSAQQDAAQALYNVEGGIEAYVAQTGANLKPATEVLFTPPGGAAADRVRMSITLISQIANANPFWPPDSTFAIVAQPERGGRTVQAMALLTSKVLDIGKLAGVWTGSDLDVRGNTTISDRSTLCADSVAEHALEIAPDADATLGNNVNLVGDSATVAVRPSDFVETTFGTTLEGLIAMADIRFARGQFSGGTSITSAGSTVDPANPQATLYNWGCPEDMYLTSQDATACENDSDQSWLPIVAIDASKSDGSWGSVTVNVSHAQGLLVVYNGNLRLQGDLNFKGVILVEGAFDVHASGGGSSSPKIEGALVGLGMGPGGMESYVDQDIQGTPTIRYNGCAIQELRDAFKNDNKYVRITRPVFGWVEVIR